MTAASCDCSRSADLQIAETASSLALRYFVPLALAAGAALLLSQRYVDAIAIPAICAMGPISEQVCVPCSMS